MLGALPIGQSDRVLTQHARKRRGPITGPWPDERAQLKGRMPAAPAPLLLLLLVDQRHKITHTQDLHALRSNMLSEDCRHKDLLQ